MKKFVQIFSRKPFNSFYSNFPYYSSRYFHMDSFYSSTVSLMDFSKKKFLRGNSFRNPFIYLKITPAVLPREISLVKLHSFQVPTRFLANKYYRNYSSNSSIVAVQNSFGIPSDVLHGIPSENPAGSEIWCISSSNNVRCPKKYGQDFDNTNHNIFLNNQICNECVYQNPSMWWFQVHCT